MPSKELREVIAAIVAPWAAPAVFALEGLIKNGEAFSYNEGPWVVVVSILVSYIALFFVGVPLVLFLRHRRILSAPILVVTGAVSGGLVMYIFFIVFALSLGTPLALAFADGLAVARGFIVGAVLGGCVAFVFALIAGITWRSTGTRKPSAPV
jgi:hypothetical protein